MATTGGAWGVEGVMGGVFGVIVGGFVEVLGVGIAFCGVATVTRASLVKQQHFV